MKLFYTLFLLMFILTSLKTQVNYSFSPAKTITVAIPLSETTELKIDINNISNSKLVLNWYRITNTLPVTWQYTTCDNVFCYGNVPSGIKTMDTIAIGGQSFITLGIDPGNNLSSGQVQIYVYQEGLPNAGDTLTWNLTSQAVGINEIFVESQISIYPTPCIDMLKLNFPIEQMPSQVYLIDITGKKIKNLEVSEINNVVNLSELKSGYYNLIFEFSDRKISKKIIKL